MTKLAIPIRRLVKIDEFSSAITYIGEAAFGVSDATPAWRIFKLETIGTVTSILWADGDDNFDNVWNNRTSLTYT